MIDRIAREGNCQDLALWSFSLAGG